MRTLVDNNHKTLKRVKTKNDEISNNGKGIGEENRSFEDLKKDYPNGNEKLEEALLIYIGENDLKLLTTEFPDKWKYFT